VLVCVLLFGMQSVLDMEMGKPQFRCGCACVRCEPGTGACADTECGIQYSTPTQAPTCAVPRPQRWPALVQVPDAQAHQLWCQASGSWPDCPVTVLLTGGNRQLSQGIIIIYTTMELISTRKQITPSWNNVHNKN
jgi:hypothetical protein